MSENKVMGWLETVCNRSADKWMLTAVRNGIFHRHWMNRAVISPEIRMNASYILQTWGLICGFYVFLVLEIDLLGLAAIFGVEMYTFHRIHGAYHFPSAHHIGMVSGLLIGKMMPLYKILAIAQPTMTILWLLYRAYFWNRRARRLQNDPAPFVSDPSVWPPAPRFGLAKGSAPESPPQPSRGGREKI